MNPDKYMQKGRVQLLNTEPFFATLVLRLKPVKADWVPIMATDGAHLFWNPAGVMQAMPTMGKLKTGLAHEAGHLMLLHQTRRGNRDPLTWNMAGDHACNIILKKAGYEEIDGWLCDMRFDGMTAERIYDILYREQQGQGQGRGKGPGGSQAGSCLPGGHGQQRAGTQSPAGKPQHPTVPNTPGGFGQVLDAPKEQAAQQEQEWREAVQTAAQVARRMGRLPAGVDRLVDELRKSKINWREILRRFVADVLPYDFRWSRPNRRLIGQGLYLPSVTKEGLGEMVFANDASGSIHSEELRQWTGENAAIHSELKPAKTTVLYFDTKVYNVEEFGPDEELVFRPKGGGGTDFRPVFDYIAESGQTPSCLIFFTDLAGRFPKEPPDYPVLWASVTDGKAPFGETIHFH